MDNLTVNYINIDSSSNFNISWSAPAGNDPDITYCITVTNSSVTDMCGMTDTHYLFQQDFNPCVEYNVTVTPVNGVGNGSSSLLSFPSKIEDIPVHYYILIYTL